MWQTITREDDSNFGAFQVDALNWDVYTMIVPMENPNRALIEKNDEPYACLYAGAWMTVKDDLYTPVKAIPALAPMFQRKLDTWLAWKRKQVNDKQRYWRKRLIMNEADEIDSIAIDLGISAGKIELGLLYDGNMHSLFLSLDQSDALIQLLMEARATAIQWSAK
jgi:hypothetical protein